MLYTRIYLGSSVSLLNHESREFPILEAVLRNILSRVSMTLDEVSDWILNLLATLTHTTRNYT
jgi:hypothetical protein